MTRPTRIPGRRFLHSPGPTHLPDEVLDAMHRQPMDLGDPRLARHRRRLRSRPARLLGTARGRDLHVRRQRPRRLGGGDREPAAPGAAVLIPGTGHFSRFLGGAVRSLGRRVLRTPWREGLPIDPPTSRPCCATTARTDRGRLRGAHRHRQQRHQRPGRAARRRSTPAATRRCSSSTRWPRWARRRWPWTRSASTWWWVPQKGLMLPPGHRLRGRRAGGAGSRRAQPGAALLLGLERAAARWPTRSSAARRR
jgi:hypothetical protein